MPRPARSRRTCHAVPGSSERFLAKAPQLDADEVFLDLEDAVAPSAKEEARWRVIQALKETDFGPKTVVVRVNATDTPHYYRDLIGVVEQAGDRLDAIMLPKVRTPGDVEMTDKLLTQIELSMALEPGRIGIEAQIEDAAGLIACEAIATASARMETLIFGPGDYSAAVGIPVTTIGARAARLSRRPPQLRLLPAGRRRPRGGHPGHRRALRGGQGRGRPAGARSSSRGRSGWTASGPSTRRRSRSSTTRSRPRRDEWERAEAMLAAYERASSGEARGAAMFEGEMIDEANRRMAERLASRRPRGRLRGGLSRASRPGRTAASAAPASRSGAAPSRSCRRGARGRSRPAARAPRRGRRSPSPRAGPTRARAGRARTARSGAGSQVEHDVLAAVDQQARTASSIPGSSMWRSSVPTLMTQVRSPSRRTVGPTRRRGVNGSQPMTLMAAGSPPGAALRNLGIRTTLACDDRTDPHRSPARSRLAGASRPRPPPRRDVTLDVDPLSGVRLRQGRSTSTGTATDGSSRSPGREVRLEVRRFPYRGAWKQRGTRDDRRAGRVHLHAQARPQPRGPRPARRPRRAPGRRHLRPARGRHAQRRPRRLRPARLHARLRAAAPQRHPHHAGLLRPEGRQAHEGDALLRRPVQAQARPLHGEERAAHGDGQDQEAAQGPLPRAGEGEDPRSASTAASST